uniref:Glucose-methanol-choline oxidoreductase C-terminal domain-containing protein n=1 Tax=Megaselia scalaris TaxID=36166 RepID=T1GX75_MEGSC
MSTTVYHPVGTARMGPKKDPTSVVNPRLQVHDIPNLRVADASIMPDIVAANTNAACVMIGEKVSDFIKEDWSDNSSKHSEL